jgi:hypothetical protein
MLATNQFRIFCLLICSIKIKIYETIILPVLFYGCETWPPTLREEHRLRIFENRVLRVFGPKRKKWQEAVEDSITKYC